MSVYKRENGEWVKKTAFERQSGEWVQISSAESSGVYDDTLPITWNTLDVANNAKAVISEDEAFVKISNLVLSVDELECIDLEIGNEDVTYCLYVYEAQTCDCGVYAFLLDADMSVNFPVVSVATAGESEDLNMTFPEAGLYVMDIPGDVDIFDGCIKLAKATYFDQFPAEFTAGDIKANSSATIVWGDENYIMRKVSNLTPTAEEMAELGFIFATNSGIDYCTNEVFQLLESEQVDIYDFVKVAVVKEVGAWTYDDSLTATFEETGIYVLYAANMKYAIGNAIGTASTRITTGNDGFVYKLDTSGTMTVSGNGEMVDGIDMSSIIYQTDGPTDIVFEEGITSIKQSLFKSNYSIINATFPSTLKTIEESAFYDCKNLSSVTIIGNIETIGKRAFRDCRKVRELVINGNNTTIETEAFYYNFDLEKVVLNGVKTIGYEAFYAPNNLAELVLGEGLETIGRYAFYQAIGITTIKMPSTLRTIELYAFYDCRNLRTIILNEGLETIRTRAFYCNEKNTDISASEVTIPSTVTILETTAFSPHITTATMLPKTPPVASGAPFPSTNLTKLYVPSGCSEAYKAATYWSKYADIIIEMEE